MSLIRSKVSTTQYRDNWDRIFEKQAPEDEPDPEDISEQLANFKIKECKDIEPKGGGSIRG